MHISNLRLKNIYDGCPYIPKAKCRNLVNGRFDNGRVLEADYFEITVTDIDYEIISNQYDFEFLGVDVWASTYDYLPKELREYLKQLFTDKTALKGVDAMADSYFRAKVKINSAYGLTAQNPVRIPIIFNGLQLEEDMNANILGLLQISKNRAFMPYQWGVWVTAWARWHLQQAINLVGDDFIYTDTDSVKYIGEYDFSKLNDFYFTRSKESGGFADDKHGKTHYLGVFEAEETADCFITLGAKKYAAEYDGKIKITLAGVNKKKGGEELKEKGGLSAFKKGLIFEKAGGNEVFYNDISKPYKVKTHGKTIEIRSNCYIRDGVYTLGITDEYQALLEYSNYILRNDTK